MGTWTLRVYGLRFTKRAKYVSEGQVPNPERKDEAGNRARRLKCTELHFEEFMEIFVGGLPVSSCPRPKAAVPCCDAIP